MRKEVYSVRLSDDDVIRIYRIKNYYKEKEQLQLTASDVIIAAINNLYHQKIEKNSG